MIRASSGNTASRFSAWVDGVRWIHGGIQIQGSADNVINFRLRGRAEQTADFFQITDSALAPKITIDKDYNFLLGGNLITLNDTHEDIDGGGETYHTFRREDGAGTQTSCFRIEGSHDGSGANDQLGRGIWSRNTGAGLVEGMRLDVDGTKFGGTTNYLQISDAGILTLEGSAKRVLTLRPEINVDEIKKQTVPDQVEIGVFFGYSLPIWNAAAGGDNLDHQELFFRENIPGRWDEESDLTVHILCAIAAAEDVDDNFKFELSYEHAHVANDVIPVTTHEAYADADVVDGSQYAVYQLEFTIDYDVSAPNSMEAHDLLVMRLRRVDSDGTEVDGEIIVFDWHIDHQVNKMFKAA